jgi:hypothetical protein
MPADGDFDYRTLDHSQLLEALDNIDATAFPINYRRLTAEITARKTGASPEPPPPDTKSDATIAFWMDVVIGAMLTLYVVASVASGELYIPMLAANSPEIHLHGRAAWMGEGAVLLVAGLIIAGGLDNSDPPRIWPAFRIAFRIAGFIIFCALALQRYGLP